MQSRQFLGPLSGWQGMPSWVPPGPGPGLAPVSLVKGLLDRSALLVWSVSREGVLTVPPQAPRSHGMPSREVGMTCLGSIFHLKKPRAMLFIVNCAVIPLIPLPPHILDTGRPAGPSESSGARLARCGQAGKGRAHRPSGAFIPLLMVSGGDSLGSRGWCERESSFLQMRCQRLATAQTGRRGWAGRGRKFTQSCLLDRAFPLCLGP